ncbi:MAG: hypothetical protein SFY32_04360 [Bacteroidota bacterium]|nr:hypothetical protein [Bacteroidota bacterium]
MTEIINTIDEISDFLDSLHVEHVIENHWLICTKEAFAIHIIILQSNENQLDAISRRSKILEKRNEVKSIELWEDIWRCQQYKVKELIKAKLGFVHVIQASETSVANVDKNTANDFLNKYHLKGETNSEVRLGIIYKHTLIGLATFSGKLYMKNEPNPYTSYELIRFCFESGIFVVGGFAKLLHHFYTKFQPGGIMTYADVELSDGEMYTKNGFIFKEFTTPIEFLVSKKDLKRTYLKNMTNRENVNLEEDYYKICNLGNYKFIKRYV